MGQLSGIRHSLCCGAIVLDSTDNVTICNMPICSWCEQPCTVVIDDDGSAAEDNQMQEDMPYPGYGQDDDMMRFLDLQ